MVKLRNPLMSLHASGRLSPSLQFQRTASGTYAGRKRIPKQPRTLAQMATRRFMSWLASAWSDLTSAERATWSNHPDVDDLSPYHVYLKFNASRFKDLVGERWYPDNYDYYPSAIYPADKSTDPGTQDYYNFNYSRSAPVLQYSVNPVNDNWAIVFAYTTYATDTSPYDRTIHVRTVTTSAVITYELPPADDQASRLHVLRLSRTGKVNVPRYNYWTLPPP